MIVSHVAFDVAVHAHPVPAVTLTLPVAAIAGALKLIGLIEYVQLLPAAWFTVKVCPPMVSVPVRAAPVFAATEYPTEPLPEPLAPLVIVSHAAFDVAVQAHPAPAVTLTVPVVAPAAGFELVGLIEYEQPVPAVIVKFTLLSSK